MGTILSCRHLVLFSIIAMESLFIHAAFGANILQPTGPQPFVTNPQEKAISLYENSYALLISVSNYKNENAWPKLKNTRDEVDLVAQNLRNHGFEVHRVLDPDGDTLGKEIKTFMNTYGRKVNSRILFFYSGHGHFDKATDSAFLVPTDAMDAAAEGTNFYSVAYAMDELRREALKMPAKHGLFIFDNCYSGMIFKAGNEAVRPSNYGSSAVDRWNYLIQNSRVGVRQFVSAGGPDQKLPGKSAFVPILIQGLKGGASRSDDGYVTGKELGLFLSEEVTKVSPSQRPQSDVIGEILGDMVFQIKGQTQRTEQSKVVKLPESDLSVKGNVPSVPENDSYDKGLHLLQAGDYPTSFSVFQKLARLGDRNSQYQLGKLYMTGLGVEKNDAQAHFWFKSAAQLGVKEAQHNVAVTYQEGKGVPKDEVQAKMWFKLAAQQGFAPSQEVLNRAGVPFN